ncbi:type IV secretory system conjugative DNA transfer family protein [Halobacteriales archaeon Cl-PHB]
MPDDALPATTDHAYIRITPTDDPLDPTRARAAFRRLHGLEPATDGGTQATSRLKSLLPTPSPSPTIEWLLVADPDSDPTLTYAVGVDPPSLIDPLEGILRDCFPRSYEFEHVDAHPAASALGGDPAASVEFYGSPDRPKDWQTRLTPFAEWTDGEGERRVPLSGVAETLADVAEPTVVQVCCQPHPDWSSGAELRREQLRDGTDTLGGQLESVLFGPPGDDYEIPAGDQARREELAERNARRSFVVSARAIAAAPAVAADLETALGHVGHTCYDVDGERAGEPARVRDAIHERTVHPPDYGGLEAKLPGRSPRAKGIVADPSELGNFCLVDGGALTTEGARAIAPTPGERTARGQPPTDRLRPYRAEGLTLGRPLDADGQPSESPVALPPSLQPLHSGIFGKTGAGKTTLALRAMLDNHAATDGADIVIAPKGDGMPDEYLRAHYARFGSLDDVVYFDCADILPAFSFFDIREDLAAGVDRTTAVEDRVDHYLEILRSVMGRDRFEQAVRSPDIIRYLVKALFDPVSGDEAFAHRDLHTAVMRMHDRQTAPPVADEDLERMLAGVVANTGRTFDELMQGVANRIEKIPVDRRLARIFNHVPDGGDPQFDLADVLDEDKTVIFDTGGLRSESQRVLALVVLSNLWSALRRRAQDRDEPGADAQATDDAPLVNLYVEEASSIAVSDLFTDLLAQGRGFGCAVTLLMQFPGQLGATSDAAYDELVNNVSTVVTGNVPNDRRLARRLATDDCEPGDVANRLRALARGEWLVSLPSEFDTPEPRPFRVASPEPPRGTSAADQGLPAHQRQSFEDALFQCRDRTLAEAGLRLSDPSTAHFTDDPATAFELNFVEPMVTVDYVEGLQGVDRHAIPQPEAYPMAGWYPTAYSVRDLGDGGYAVVMEAFVEREG